ncbi:MAG: hypothetical protein ACOY90_07125 [Candidatus Zhuqueibacterota bacterium]
MKKNWLWIGSCLLIVSCAGINNYVNSPTSEEPVIYGSDEVSWCTEYNDAVTRKKLVSGMSCEMVNDVMGAPISKKQQSNDLVMWEYQDKQLFFLQDLLVSWKDK